MKNLFFSVLFLSLIHSITFAQDTKSIITSKLNDEWGQIKFVKEIKPLKKDDEVKYYTFNYKNKTGIVDVKGNLVLSPQWEYCSQLVGCNEWVYVQGYDNKRGIYNLNKRDFIFYPKYDNVFLYNFDNSISFGIENRNCKGLAIIKKDVSDSDLSKLTNKDIKVIIQPDKYYDIARRFEGYAVYLSPNGKGLCGFVDSQGKEVISPDRYTDIYKQYNGKYIVKLGNRCGVADIDGKLEFFTKYNSMLYDDLTNNYIVYIGTSAGRIAIDGSVIEEPSFSYYYSDPFKFNGKDFRYTVDERGNVGLCDVDNNLLLGNMFDELFPHKNYIFSLKDGYEGLYDTKTGWIINVERKYHLIVPSELNNIKYFTTRRGKFQGICDSIGNEVICPDRWLSVSPFSIDSNNKFSKYRVRNEFGEGIIDMNNNIIIEPRYDNVYKSTTFKGKYRVCIGDKEGLCNESGQELIPPVFTNISNGAIGHPQSILYKVEDNGLIGFYNSNGKCIIKPANYASASYQMNYDNNIPVKLAIKLIQGDYVEYYDTDGTLLYKSGNPSTVNSFLEKADSEFKLGNYNSARKYYEKAHSLSPSFLSAYNIAVCYYNSDKLGNVSKYLRESLRYPHSSMQESKAYDFINETEAMLQAKRDERNRNIAEIFGFFVNTTMYAIDSYYSSASYNQSSINSSPNHQNKSRQSNPSESDYKLNSSSDSHKSKCGICSGKGSIVEYTSNYGVKEDSYCGECGKTVTNGHYHRTCAHCGGTGLR